jgi:cytochrome c oxidase assembly protein subunit 15
MYSRSLHIIALLTAVATFPLIFMGGLVTSHQAGMSVPDWPNSYGYNMFLFPPRLWIGNIFYEHTHRLMGTVVGMLSILLTIVACKIEQRRWVRWLAAAVLGAVIFQGVLGGLRVVLVQLDLAIVHACVAQAFFCLAALVAIVTSRWWIDSEIAKQFDSTAARRPLALAGACVFAIYLQLIVGATMRHYDAGLAIPDLPLAYGKALPPADDASLHTLNQQRIWEMNLKPVTLGQVWLHFAHRLGAILVSTLILTLAFVIVRRSEDRRVTLLACLLVIELLAQLTLGVLTVVLRKPADVASFHVAVGALTLVTAWTLTVCLGRRYASFFSRRSASALSHDDQIPIGALTA